MSDRINKVAEVVHHLSAEYLSRESNKKSLITVTRTSVSPDLKNCTVYITVLPLSYEAHALEFCNRKAGEFRGVLKKKLSLRRVPFILFEIDNGEKNRQLIDELSQSSYNEEQSE